jgi:hypothetical protein
MNRKRGTVKKFGLPQADYGGSEGSGGAEENRQFGDLRGDENQA